MEFYKIAIRYLKQCNIKASSTFIRQRLVSHPDYPMLVSFTDTLDEMGIKYSAIVADKLKYQELSYPLLAHGKKEGKDRFVLIESLNNFENNSNALLNEWNGIALMVSPNSKITYNEHNLYRKKEINEQTIIISILLISLVILLGSLFSNFTYITFTLMLLNITGICICTLIVLHNLGTDFTITEQLCSGEGSKGCDEVLHSNVATLLPGLGLGDLGIIYFSLQCTFIFLSLLFNQNSLPFLAILNGGGLLFSFASLIYQWSILKSWCRMCLIVVGLIWVQSIVLGIMHGDIFIQALLPSQSAIFLALFVSVITWLITKQWILEKASAQRNEIELTKWKRNPKFFLANLYSQRSVNTRVWEDELIFGNPIAPIQILIVCNPYCIPCEKAHKELENLLTLYPEAVCLHVRFVLNPGNSIDKHSLAVFHIIDAYHGSLNGRLNAVSDWFELMDLDKYKTIYQDATNNDQYIDLLEKYKTWSSVCKITHTPTIFINSFELTKPYKVGDLKLLINHISEEITQPNAVANAER
jgi:hypothetical protein